MSTTEPTIEQVLPAPPKRADARRNYDKVIAAAREAFAERGTSTSLEEIARRAEVGIGTLYRNFPNRQALLEAVYVDEVESLCRSSAEFDGLEPWEGFVAWVHRLAGYLVTKQALAHELLEYVDRASPLFQGCRGLMLQASRLVRAQQAEAVRPDTDVWQIIQLTAIAKIPGAEPRRSTTRSASRSTACATGPSCLRRPPPVALDADHRPALGGVSSDFSAPAV
jgi:AcrR family transcriptional regulator